MILFDLGKINEYNKFLWRKSSLYRAREKSQNVLVEIVYRLFSLNMILCSNFADREKAMTSGSLYLLGSRHSSILIRTPCNDVI